jgi:hypothetical protein
VVGSGSFVTVVVVVEGSGCAVFVMTVNTVVVPPPGVVVVVVVLGYGSEPPGESGAGATKRLQRRFRDMKSCAAMRLCALWW